MRWETPVLALAAVRVAIPLVVLAASGRDLPGLPPYTYREPHGDAFGFHAAAREFMATLGAVHPLLLAAGTLVLVGATWIAIRIFRLGLRWQAVALVTAVVSFGLALVIGRTDVTGAAVFGWSLVWAVPMFPYRALGLPLDPDVAFVFGLVLSLAANAVAVVATGFLGFHASGRRAVGIGAAALLASWPLLAGLLAGPSAWENGQWEADVGLHLYTEPLSTALVTVALALLLSPRRDDLRLSIAGVALGYATFTKLSNGLVALAAALLVAFWLGPRRSLPLVIGGLAIVPMIAVYWSRGYPEIGYVPGWSAEFAARNWQDSLIFDPPTLVVLLTPALLGALALRHTRALQLLGAAVAVTAGLYTFYEVTWLHPRFLYVALPPLFVLVAAGFDLVARTSAGLARRGRTAPVL